MKQQLKVLKNTRLWCISGILGFVFAIFTLIGNSLEKTGSLALCIGNRNVLLRSGVYGILLLLIFGTAVFVLYVLLERFGAYCWGHFTQKTGKDQASGRGFFTYFLTVILVWSPVLFIFYPGTTNVTVRNEVFSYFGIANETTRRITLLDESVLINGHHSVFHTLLLGWCVSLGRKLGSDNLGLFFYTITQFLLFAAVLAGMMVFLGKIGVHRWIRRGIFFIYLLFPLFPFRTAISLNKDELYAILYLLFILLCTAFLKDTALLGKKRMLALFWVNMLLVMLIRRNGLYAILLTAPFLIFSVKKGQRIKLSVLILTAVLFFTVIVSDVIYPMCSFTAGSKSSALAVPFQQTACYKAMFGDEVTPEEYEAINRVLEYDEIEYSPQRASGVLPHYRKEATGEDLKAYFKVWYQMFLKHPLTYVTATLNNCYGYFYPATYRKEVILAGIVEGSNHGGEFHFHNLDVTKNVREKIYEWSLCLPQIPVVKLFFSTGLYTWIAMFLAGYLLFRKRYREITLFIPLAVNVLICMVSPVNTMLRYMLPVIICLPFLTGICLHEKEQEVEEKTA